MRKLLFVVSLLASLNAHAFGIGDLMSAGLSVVGQVGGAAIDKAMADTPEEKAAKRAKFQAEAVKKFNADAAKIEATKGLTPLQKEKNLLLLSTMYAANDVADDIEAQKKVDKALAFDSMKTGVGLAGVATTAVMNTPTAVSARADMAVKAGTPQAQSRNVLAQYDAGKSGMPAVANPVEVAATRQRNAQAMENTQATMNEISNKFSEGIAESRPLYSVERPVDIVNQDKSRKIFVEFVNGKALTQRLRDLFINKGFTVVDSEADAEVVYQFDGDYAVTKTQAHEGANEALGAYVDNPHVITVAAREVSTTKKIFSGLFTVASGAKMPEANANANLYKQQAIVVANRKFEGKETRIAAIVNVETKTLDADAVINQSLSDIENNIGFHPVQVAQTEDQSKPVERHYDSDTIPAPQ